MKEDQIISEFGRMWGADISDFILVKSDKSVFGYIIMNVKYNSMVIIEDDDAVKYIIKSMLEHGATILDDVSKTTTFDRPDPIFFSSEHEKQYRAFMEKKRKKDKE